MVNSELDERLIKRIAEGDSEAFKAVYISTKSAVYGLALSVLGRSEDAEDVMHDTYISVFNSAKGYVPMGKPLSWIMTIARNLSYNHIRDRKDTDDIQDHETDLSTDAISDEDNRIVLEAALKCLAQDEREIVMLHALTGMKHKEISEIMDMPLATVLSKYNRALKKMRNEIEQGESHRHE